MIQNKRVNRRSSVTIHHTGLRRPRALTTGRKVHTQKEPVLQSCTKMIRTTNCWSGCTKCGGCKFYHKRQRMLNQGKKLCTVHKYSLHLDADCWRHQPNKRRNRGKGQFERRQIDRGGRKYRASSARQRRRSRSRSKSRSKSPLPRRRHRSPSPSPSDRLIPAKYIKPQYLDRLHEFAHRKSRRNDRQTNTYHPWSSANDRMKANNHTSGGRSDRSQATRGCCESIPMGI